MRQTILKTLLRITIYIIILINLFAIFGGAADPPPTGRFASYIGYYSIPFGFWIMVFELWYQAIKRIRRSSVKKRA